MPAEIIAGPIACSQCGSPGLVKRYGRSTFMVVPKRLKECHLHKNPERRCGGSLSSVCRSGMTPDKTDAIRQWNTMWGLTNAR